MSAQYQRLDCWARLLTGYLRAHVDLERADELWFAGPATCVPDVCQPPLAEARRRFEAQPRILAMLAYNSYPAVPHTLGPEDLAAFQAGEAVYVALAWQHGSDRKPEGSTVMNDRRPGDRTEGSPPPRQHGPLLRDSVVIALR